MINNKKQVELIWAILCQNVSVDAKTNAMSIFNVLEEIQVAVPEEKKKELEMLKGEGFLLPLTSVLTIYLRNLTNVKNLEAPIKIRILDPNGKQLEENLTIAKFEGKPNHRILANLNVFKATVSGKYTFHISAQEPGSSSFSEIGSTSVLLHIS